MTDLEKVIKGLECCIPYESEGNEHLCIYDDDYNPNCPYRGTGSYGVSCMTKLMRDALALLKAREPRVMTLEEYDAWTDIPFTERDPVFHEERTKRGSVTCWTNTTVCSLREYGKNDRCWTSRPTVEQMEAIPWN